MTFKTSLFIARDVHCYENIFPFSNSLNPTDSVPLTEATSSLHTPLPPSHPANPLNSRPHRVAQKPTWLQDYTHFSTSQPVCGSGNGAHAMSTMEPTSFHQANIYDIWRKAMQAESDALLRN